MMDIFKLKKLGLFAGGVLFGTAGVKILGSEDAAAGLRARDCVMTTATNIQENAEDILAEAKQINEARGYESFGEDEDFNEAAETTEAAPEAEKAEQ